MTVEEVELLEVRFPIGGLGDVQVWAQVEPDGETTVWVERAVLERGGVITETTGRTRTVKVDR